METGELVLDIDGMTCASCVQKVERALGEVEGVQAAAVNLATRTATVRGDVGGLDRLIGAVSRVGYGARPHDDNRDPAAEERSYRRRLRVAAPLTVAILALTFVAPDGSGAGVLPHRWSSGRDGRSFGTRPARRDTVRPRWTP